MKKSFLLLLPAALTLASCVDTLDKYSIDTKKTSTAPGTALIANAERSLARINVTANTNEGSFRYFVQYWAATDYPRESLYDINTRAINESVWTRHYRDVLADLKEGERNITANIQLEPIQKANQLACGEVLQIYAWANLVDTFGDVPYSQALDISNPQPKYDDDKAIYSDLIARLDVAIGKMTTTSPGLGSSDLINGGNMGLWKKFANSLKLRMAMVIADDSPTTARTMAEAAVASGVLTSNADVIDLSFATNPNANPLWEDLVQSGRADFVGTDVFIDRLNSLSDPRLPSFFKLAAGGTTYIGGTYGTTNAYDDYSAPGTRLETPSLPAVFMSYAYVQFLLADAASRGFSVGGTTASFYNAGVTASIAEWGGTAAAAAAYLARPDVTFATAIGTTDKAKIGNQEWIALYNQPFDAYREWRRLDAPQLIKPTAAISDIPLRLPYPVVEQNVNGASYATATAAIGGDRVTTKIFWDKF